MSTGKKAILHNLEHVCVKHRGNTALVHKNIVLAEGGVKQRTL